MYRVAHPASILTTATSVLVLSNRHDKMVIPSRPGVQSAMGYELSDPETWLAEHGDSLYRYALARTGDPAKAEDLLQDTLLAALQARDRYNGLAQERTWLTGILKHKLIDHLRVRHREVSTDFESDEGMESADTFNARGGWQVQVKAWHRPDDAMRQDAFMTILEQCIDALPERAAEAFRLRELHGFDTEEICAALEVTTANNLFVILSRARMRLRDCLTQHWFAVEGEGGEAC